MKKRNDKTDLYVKMYLCLTFVCSCSNASFNGFPEKINVRGKEEKKEKLVLATNLMKVLINCYDIRTHVFLL